MSAAIATPAQPETLDLPATKMQPLRLVLQLRRGDLNCAAYVRSRPFAHVVFACSDGWDDWRIVETSSGCDLWISRTAFELDPKHADKVRAFLAHTKAAT